MSTAPQDPVAFYSMVGAVVSACAATVSIGVAWWTLRGENRQFKEVQARETKVSIAANYLALETASSQIFQYMADNHKKLAPLRGPLSKTKLEGAKNRLEFGVLLELYYQSLNLFEVCARFRRQDLVTPEVFASWIAWMTELLEDDYFLANWHDVIRTNYTRDVRDIFDVGVEIFAQAPVTRETRRAFYAAVADIMAKEEKDGTKTVCTVISGWIDDIETPALWSSLRSFKHFNPDRPSAAEAQEAAAFAARVIGADARYISHGEIQTGLSLDGKRWAPNIAELYAEDFADLGDERELIVTRDEDGTMIGMAIIAWEHSARRRFAVLEDMAVDPALRSQGIGLQLLRTVEARVAGRGIDWLFLESGLQNHGAHRFFERNGFETVSHVFAKRLEA